MKIKRIEILGFKSFVDRVVLDFPHGITAVVGPNGCGKSNIVDAIRWVMGEQSAKNLRGRSMEDVIFGGSETRKPLGMAEVSLVFSTEDGRVPAKYLNYSEIQVTRRLYRDGDSEYFLNKTSCRLLDIHELFMDTGVGAKAYSVIEQGRIGMILLSKPEERRFLIEEAAGVTKFKARKQVAIKKIEVTKQNLVRIGDIVSEIRRQMNSLHRQAKKAEKFRTYREELKEIELQFAAIAYASLNSTYEDAAREAASLAGRVAALGAELEKGELDFEGLRLSLTEEEKKLNSAQEEIYRAKSTCQSCESRIDFQRKELLNIERQRDKLREELASLEKQLVDTGEELASLQQKKGVLGTDAAGEDLVLQEKERELDDLSLTEKELTERLEEKRREVFSLLSSIAQFNNQKGALLKRIEGIAERHARNRREEAALREKLADTSGRTAQFEGQLKDEREAKAVLASEIDLLRQREEELKRQLEKQDRELVAKRDELSRKSSRLHSLQELDAQLAGYGKGVRTLLLSDHYKSRFAGVLADVIETGSEYEAALEAVLGERLQYVMGGDEGAALEAIEYLKKAEGGRCCFVVPGASTLEPVPTSGQSIPLLQLITVKEGFRSQVEPLVADVHLCDDIKAGVELSRHYPRCTFVTREGDMAFGGCIYGGSSETVQQGLIHKKREIKELSQEMTLLTRAVQELETGKQESRSALSTAEDGLRSKRQNLHQTEIAILNHEKDLQRVRDEGQRIEERLSVQAVEDKQLSEEKNLLEKELADSEHRKCVTEGMKGSLEASLEELQKAISLQKGKIEQVREEVTGIKVRAAALREKREANLRAIKRSEEHAHDLQRRITNRGKELENVELERQQLASAAAAGEEELTSLLQRQLAAEQSLATVREAYEKSSEQVREEEGRLRQLREALGVVRREEGERNLQATELSMKISHLRDSVMEKYRLEVDALRQRFNEFNDNDDWSEEAQRHRQSELQKLVDELGEVNLTAIEEYRELETRYNFLVEQKVDLEDSLTGLQKAIQRINRTTRKRFLETFEQVNQKFQEVFPRLFCGGRAELRLTDEEDLLETGIDIIVQPPGKKLQNVALLSGGEKALTAVALIFSIFLIKPSPFCLLDEVDAPLDDANIGRFNEMVKEMTEFSQFIMITHSKTTMMVADTLYGITMEEPGVSKLVSVRLGM
ncbi:chromosome segregation protein SMC [Geobacter sp. DSM 9736]|uniref:chromosome segregation protein SMC n=1 Tax=Geobacter sp. DSM 9736 TaxID=1277350 RepID=UPI000B50050C|nr:chromosome segregation protein SMC [Geobacter sp. DSM 9736]SNB46342.1 condensin subunit Smc [Geobacter sp. DSM 9736]